MLIMMMGNSSEMQTMLKHSSSSSTQRGLHEHRTPGHTEQADVQGGKAQTCTAELQTMLGVAASVMLAALRFSCHLRFSASPPSRIACAR